MLQSASMSPISISYISIHVMHSLLVLSHPWFQWFWNGWWNTLQETYVTKRSHQNRILKVIHRGLFCFIFLMYIGFRLGMSWYNPVLTLLTIFSWLCLIINYSIEKLEFAFQWLQGWRQNCDSSCKVLTCFIALLSTRTVLARLKSQHVFHWQSSWGSCVVFPSV